VYCVNQQFKQLLCEKWLNVCVWVEMFLLQHAERRWFALYKDFTYENIAVSHDKEIFIIDYEELSIIENPDFDEANGS